MLAVRAVIIKAVAVAARIKAKKAAQKPLLNCAYLLFLKKTASSYLFISRTGAPTGRLVQLSKQQASRVFRVFSGA